MAKLRVAHTKKPQPKQLPRITEHQVSLHFQVRKSLRFFQKYNVNNRDRVKNSPDEFILCNEFILLPFNMYSGYSSYIEKFRAQTNKLDNCTVVFCNFSASRVARQTEVGGVCTVSTRWERLPSKFLHARRIQSALALGSGIRRPWALRWMLRMSAQSTLFLPREENEWISHNSVQRRHVSSAMRALFLLPDWKSRAAFVELRSNVRV